MLRFRGKTTYSLDYTNRYLGVPNYTKEKTAGESFPAFKPPLNPEPKNEETDNIEKRGFRVVLKPLFVLSLPGFLSYLLVSYPVKMAKFPLRNSKQT